MNAPTHLVEVSVDGALGGVLAELRGGPVGEALAQVHCLELRGQRGELLSFVSHVMMGGWTGGCVSFEAFTSNK
jgi:hypothetical protein